VIFPTASQDQFGSGKYQLQPILGARYKLPELSLGSFAELVARYAFDVDGYGGRSHLSQFRFSPTLSVALPDRWFVTLYPSQDIVVNLLAAQGGLFRQILAGCAKRRGRTPAAVVSDR
jgi:hypothetical protein